MDDLNGKNVLITGGTGSFGKHFLSRLLKQFPNIARIVVYSRDELKQYEMRSIYPMDKYPMLRFFIGDIRDINRLTTAMEDIDVVIHTAALKQVPTAEYNPFECIKTNIIGSQNVIEASLKSGVQKVVALSTDKAAAPINLYGATKLCSDKLFIAANNMRGKRDINFSVVRYGNVMGSRGSVMPFFLEKKNSGKLPITHPDMTRFNISLDEGVDLVLFAINHAIGGEVFVPKLPSYKILDVAAAIGPECEIEYVGIRPGEKIHEEMITVTDSLYTIETDYCYIITPNSIFLSDEENIERFCKKYNATKVDEGFSYNSGTNNEWLNVEEISSLVKKLL